MSEEVFTLSSKSTRSFRMVNMNRWAWWQTLEPYWHPILLCIHLKISLVECFYCLNTHEEYNLLIALEKPKPSPISRNSRRQAFFQKHFLLKMIILYGNDKVYGLFLSPRDDFGQKGTTCFGSMVINKKSVIVIRCLDNHVKGNNLKTEVVCICSLFRDLLLKGMCRC